MNFGWGCFIFCKTIGSKIPKDYALLCHVHVLQHKHNNIIFRVKLSMCHATNEIPHSHSTYALGKFSYYRVERFVIKKNISMNTNDAVFFKCGFLLIFWFNYKVIIIVSFIASTGRVTIVMCIFIKNLGWSVAIKVVLLDLSRKTSKYSFSGDVTPYATQKAYSACTLNKTLLSGKRQTRPFVFGRMAFKMRYMYAYVCRLSPTTS